MAARGSGVQPNARAAAGDHGGQRKLSVDHVTMWLGSSDMHSNWIARVAGKVELFWSISIGRRKLCSPGTPLRAQSDTHVLGTNCYLYLRSGPSVSGTPERIRTSELLLRRLPLSLPFNNLY
jgi:hypothetical protein